MKSPRQWIALQKTIQYLCRTVKEQRLTIDAMHTAIQAVRESEQMALEMLETIQQKLR